MKSDIDMIIVHDGEKWIARNDALAAEGRTLPELDADLARNLRQIGTYKGRSLTVFMGFDFATIPTWIRQYAPHYFNRVIRVEV